MSPDLARVEKPMHAEDDGVDAVAVQKEVVHLVEDLLAAYSVGGWVAGGWGGGGEVMRFTHVG